MCGRRALATAAKALERESNDRKLELLGGMLKAFQSELDSQTKRATFAENAFLSLYKLLYDAPDPVPCLEQVNFISMNALSHHYYCI